MTAPRFLRVGLLIAVAIGWCLPVPSAARLALGVPDAGERPVLSATVGPGALTIRPVHGDRWTPALRAGTTLAPRPPQPLHLCVDERPAQARRARLDACLPVVARPPPEG